MPKILVVEDEDSLARLIAVSLTNAGYEVLRAANGNEALKLYDPAAVSLVLTDLIMPEKEGMELITELRGLNPKVKIIAMSGGGRNSPQTYLPIARAMGAALTLAKPFSPQELLAAIKTILQE